MVSGGTGGKPSSESKWPCSVTKLSSSSYTIYRSDFSSHNSRKIPHSSPSGRAMGCWSWVQVIIKVSILKSLWCARYRVIYDRNISRVHSIPHWMCRVSVCIDFDNNSPGIHLSISNAWCLWFLWSQGKTNQYLLIILQDKIYKSNYRNINVT